MSYDPDLARTALSDDERAWLLDPERCARALPVLAARHVTGVNLTGHDWAGSWSKALLEDSTFESSTFRGHRFDDALFRNIVFERCTFDTCHFASAVFESCRFVGCEIEEGTTQGAAFHDCTFVDTCISGTMLNRVRLDGVRVQGGVLSHVRLTHCSVHYLHFEGATLESVRFTLCESGRIVLSGCDVQTLGVLGGVHGTLELAASKLSGLSIVKAEHGTLRLARLSEALDVRVNEGRVGAFLLEDCAIFDLYVWRTDVGRLLLSGGSYDGWITDCTVRSGRIEDAELASFFWDASRTTDLSLSRTRLRDFLSARDAHFSRMKLEDVRYTDAFRLVLDGAVFEHSDAFVIPHDRGTP